MMLLCSCIFVLCITMLYGWEGQLLHQALQRNNVNKGWLNATEWNLPLQKGIMKGQLLKVIRHPISTNPWHTCYTVTCLGHKCPQNDNVTNIISFCYPAIIIAGMPKCGTSAMYDLLTRYTGTIVMAEKENCPYTRRRSHWEYFQSLPQMKEVSLGQVVIDACLDSPKNLLFREAVLRRPKSLYIIMVRNYADMLWSSYNFWCKVAYDGFACDNTRWVKVGMNRSAELFHAMVLKDRNGALREKDSPLHRGPPDMSRPCQNAGGYYSEYLDMFLFKSVPKNETLLLASEMLETNPLAVWRKVASKMKELTSVSLDEGGAMGISKTYTFALGSFTDRRYNAQSAKGGKQYIALKDYRPGVFNISGHKPMVKATRQMLDTCWHADCLKVAKLVEYDGYPCTNLVDIL